MNSSQYHLELGATVICTKILMEETKGFGKRALKGSTGDYFMFDSWFLLKNQGRKPYPFLLI